MNKPMMMAAGLMGLTFFVHLFAGGPEVSQPIQASTLDPVVRAVALVVWHGVSVMLAVMAAALVWLAYRENTALALMTIAIQLGFAALFIGVGWVQLGTLAPMPQWSIFVIIPALTGYAMRRA